MGAKPTEAKHPMSKDLHIASSGDVCQRVLDAQTMALAAVQPAVSDLIVAANYAANALQSGHKLAYCGAGSSGLMALADCLELFGTFGIPPDQTPILLAGGVDTLLKMTGAVEDDLAAAHRDLMRASLGPGDVLVCVSASGSTPYTLDVMQRAKAAGVSTVGIANAPDTLMLQRADLPIFLNTGPEIIAGSTRLGAATAQKAALNMLSVLVGIRLGHVHDGYMVNLVADNAKLENRAASIVATISGSDIIHAKAALAQSGGAVKPAILIAQGMTPAQAIVTLQNNNDHLPAEMPGTRD